MKYRLLFLFILITLRVASQSPDSEESFREYFRTHAVRIDQIEGIWTVSTTQEYYRYDTLYDVRKYPKAAKVAVMRKDSMYDSYNLTGTSYDVEFEQTDVKMVYLYRIYFPETKGYSKTQAVISKAGEMEYTYDFPEDYLRIKLGDSFEEGTRVVNILKWTKVFPEKQ